LLFSGDDPASRDAEATGRARDQREQVMAWIILFIAGLFEIGWAVGLKYTEGFTRPIPTILTAVSLVASMGLLGWAVKSLPLGTAYAVWTGVGAVGTAIVGILVFKEPATAARLVCLALIVSGILGLKVFSSH